jgi:hypothetical protein
LLLSSKIFSLSNFRVRILLFFGAFLICVSSFSQEITQTIRGVIIDKQSQSPLPGAIIQVLNANPPLGASADEKGEFRIQNVPIGRLQLKVNMIGYRERYITIILNAGKESVSNIELEENVVQSQEVVVTAGQDKTQTNNKMNTVSARVFSAEEAARYAGSRNDPARMAANFAGVSGANDSRNDIIIRGNSPMGVLWRLNGLDIPNPNHFGNAGSTGGPVSILNNNTLDNSDFMTGAFPADYGNATAGVFDLRMRKGNNEKFEFLGQVGFNGFELGAEGPLSKNKNSSFLMNYRYSTLSVFKALHIDFGTGSAVPQYQDLTFKTDFNTRAGKFSVWGIGGMSYIALLASDQKAGQDLYGYSSLNTYFRSNVGASGISHTYLFKNNSYLKTNIGISGQYNFIQADRIDTSFHTPENLKPEYRQKISTTHLVFNTTYNKKFNARDFVSAGVYGDLFNTMFIDSSDNIFGVHTFVTLRNYNGNTGLLRAFSQWQHKFSDKFLMNLGLSNQYFLLNGSNAIEPRLGLKYSLTEKQSLSLGGGLHSQMQPAYVYFASETLPNGVRHETNRGLDFTRAVHGVIAYDNNFSRNFRLKTEAYYQYIYSAPVKDTSSSFSALNLGADFNSPNITHLVSKGTGTNYGLELTLEKFYSQGYYFLFTTSLFQSKYKGSDGIERNTAFNGNYVVNLLAGKEFRINQKHVLMLDARATYAGGKRYTPIDLQASIIAKNEIRDESRAYSLQYPDYFRMDVKPGYRFNSKKVTHEFSIDIQNVTHHLNVFQQSYDIAHETLQTDYQLKFFVIPQYRLLF